MPTYLYEKATKEYDKYGEAGQIIFDIFNNYSGLKQHEPKFYAPREIIDSMTSNKLLTPEVLNKIINTSMLPLTRYYLTTMYPYPMPEDMKEALIECCQDKNADHLLQYRYFSEDDIKKCFRLFRSRYEYSLPVMLKDKMARVNPYILEYMIKNLDDKDMLAYDAAPYQYIDLHGSNITLREIIKQKIETTDNSVILTAIANNETAPVATREKAFFEGGKITAIIKPTPAMATAIYESCVDTALSVPDENRESWERHKKASTALLSFIDRLHPAQLTDLINRREHNENDDYLFEIARWCKSDRILSILVDHSPENTKIRQIIVDRAHANDSTIGIETYLSIKDHLDDTAKKMDLFLNAVINEGLKTSTIPSCIEEFGTSVGKHYYTALAIGAPDVPDKAREALIKMGDKYTELFCDLKRATRYCGLSSCNVFMGAVAQKLLNIKGNKKYDAVVLRNAINRLYCYDAHMRQIDNYALKNIRSDIEAFLKSETYNNASYKCPEVEQAINDAIAHIKECAEVNTLFNGGNCLSVFGIDFAEKEVVVYSDKLINYGSGTHDYAKDLEKIRRAPLKSLEEARRLILNYFIRGLQSHPSDANIAMVYKIAPLYNAINEQIYKLERDNLNFVMDTLKEIKGLKEKEENTEDAR